MLARLAADLLDLLAGPDLEKVKGCAHPGCSRLYVDSSRAQNRHWCGLLVGQSVKTWQTQVDGLAAAFGAHHVSIQPGPVATGRGRDIVLRVRHHDALAAPIPLARPCPDTPMVRLANVPVGITEQGSPWLLPVAGRHILVGGATGAGKGVADPGDADSHGVSPGCMNSCSVRPIPVPPHVPLLIRSPGCNVTVWVTNSRSVGRVTGAVGTALGQLKPSWGRLGRVRDLNVDASLADSHRLLAEIDVALKARNGAEQGQIARRRARCVSTEGRPRPRNQRSWARCAVTVVIVAAPSRIGISRRL